MRYPIGLACSETDRLTGPAGVAPLPALRTGGRFVIPRRIRRLLVFLLAAACSNATAAEHPGDAHYTAAGFFDVHVCTWPDRPQFLFMVLSTTRFAELASVKVFRPDGSAVGELDLSAYRLVLLPGKPEKRVFLKQFTTQSEDRDGWYTAKITLADGTVFDARDRVVVKSLPMARNLRPEPGAENIKLPRALEWDPVPGAGYYQVFISDLWNEGKSIFTSPLLTRPQLELPQGLLKPGGMYSWRVHARDVDQDPELGDFNSGSLSAEAKFTVE